MKKTFIRAILSSSLVIAVMFSLIACSSNDVYNMDATSKYGRLPKGKLSNMVKGLAIPRTKQSTHFISNGFSALSSTDSNPATTQHTNELLNYWPDVSNAVRQLKGVAAAHVFASNKNVYVAIKFDDQQHALTTERKGYDKFHQHEVAPRTIASMPYDYFYTLNNNEVSTNQTYHDVGRLVSNYGNPRQVFISDNHELLHHFRDFAKISRRNVSLQPWLHEFNVVVQYYFADGQTEPTKIDPNK